MTQPATIDTASVVLARGKHASREMGVCAMEAVAWLAGEPHSDRPECCCPVIAEFVRCLNDSLDDAERQGLRPYLPRLVGSRAGPEVERARVFVAADHAIRQFAPAALRAAGMEAEADRLAALPPIRSYDDAIKAIRIGDDILIPARYHSAGHAAAIVASGAAEAADFTAASFATGPRCYSSGAVEGVPALWKAFLDEMLAVGAGAGVAA